MRVLKTSIIIILSTLALTALLMQLEKKPVEPPEVYVIHLTHLPSEPLEPLRVTFDTLPKHLQTQARCLAHNIYFEARGEPLEGQLAVAHVTLNRVESKYFPGSICEVVQQQRKNVCQFSWWCSKKLRGQSTKNRLPNQGLYNEIEQLATEVMVGLHKREDITHGALFYHANYVSKTRLGALKLEPTVTIGQHIFYRKNL